MTLAIAAVPQDRSGSVICTDSMTTRRATMGWAEADFEAPKFQWLDERTPFVYSGSIGDETLARCVQRARWTSGGWRGRAFELWTELSGPQKPSPAYLVVAGADGVGLFSQAGDSEWPEAGVVVGGAVREWWLQRWASHPLTPPATMYAAFLLVVNLASMAVKANWQGWGCSTFEDFSRYGLLPPVAGPLHTLIVTPAAAIQGPEVQL